MVQYLVTYSVQSGKEDEHGRWLCDIGMNYFKKQSGFQGIRAYSTLVGSGPDWVLEVDFDTSETLMRALDTDESKRIFEDFEHLVTNLSTKILIPTVTPVGAAA